MCVPVVPWSIARTKRRRLAMAQGWSDSAEEIHNLGGEQRPRAISRNDVEALLELHEPDPGPAQSPRQLARAPPRHHVIVSGDGNQRWRGDAAPDGARAV